VPFSYIATANSRAISKKITMNKEQIKKSFLCILSAPFLAKVWADTQQLNVPINNISKA